MEFVSRKMFLKLEIMW